MARTPRKFQEGPSACYHVMNRGHNREAVFGDADDSRYFLGLLSRYQKRFPLQGKKGTRTFSVDTKTARRESR